MPLFLFLWFSCTPDTYRPAGAGFQQLPTLSFKYNDDLPEHASFITSSSIVCLSPPNSATGIKRVQLRVSNNGFDFTSDFLEFEVLGKSVLETSFFSLSPI
jgi:hypothetical protein